MLKLNKKAMAENISIESKDASNTVNNILKNFFLSYRFVHFKIRKTCNPNGYNNY